MPLVLGAAAMLAGESNGRAADPRSIQVKINSNVGAFRQQLVEDRAKKKFPGWRIYRQPRLATRPLHRLGLRERLTTRRAGIPDFLLVPPVDPTTGRPICAPILLEVTSPDENKSRQRNYIGDLQAECRACNLELIALAPKGKVLTDQTGQPVRLPLTGPLAALHRVIRVSFGDELRIYETSTTPRPPPRSTRSDW